MKFWFDPPEFMELSGNCGGRGSVLVGYKIFGQHALALYKTTYLCCQQTSLKRLERVVPEKRRGDSVPHELLFGLKAVRRNTRIFSSKVWLLAPRLIAKRTENQ